MDTTHHKINWGLIKTEKVDAATYAAITNSKGFTPTTGSASTISVIAKMNGKGFWDSKRERYCYYDEIGVVHAISIGSEDQVNAELKGLEAWNDFKLQARLRDGIDLGSYYGKLTKSNYWVKYCVVGPLNYGKPGEYDQITKIDISSAYPYELSKRLPTFNGCEVVEGYISPNEQFPFAFYSDGNLAFIEADGRYINTYTIRNSCWYGQSQRERDKLKHLVASSIHPTWILPNTPTTILCKAARGLTATANWYYSQRTIDPNSKLKANASIGYMHRNSQPLLAHIAAVVLARCANRMITMAEELRCCGNKVTLIATDSIAWTGGRIPQFEFEHPTHIKSLGCAYYELENCMMIVCGPKAYQTYNPLTTTTTTHWSGKSKAITATMSYGDIKGLEPQIPTLNTTTGKITYLPYEQGELLTW